MGTVHAIGTSDGWARQAQEQDGRTGFGEWLKRAREARGLTLDDLTRETKIPLRKLEALEHGNLGAMPTFYQRAEVRAVAKAVGVDERLAVDRLVSAITPVLEQREAKVRSPERKLTRSVALVALALGALTLTATQTGRAMFGWIAEFERRADPVSAADSGAAATRNHQETRNHQQLSPAVANLNQAITAQPLAADAPPAVADAAAAVDVTAPPGAVTELVVRTEPSGAQVTVNGIGWGASPVTIRHLPPGEKHVRATKEGFAATERVLALDAGQREALDLRLATAP